MTEQSDSHSSEWLEQIEMCSKCDRIISRRSVAIDSLTLAQWREIGLVTKDSLGGEARIFTRLCDACSSSSTVEK